MYEGVLFCNSQYNRSLQGKTVNKSSLRIAHRFAFECTIVLGTYQKCANDHKNNF